jgi:hypothetical protein
MRETQLVIARLRQTPRRSVVCPTASGVTEVDLIAVHSSDASTRF